MCMELAVDSKEPAGAPEKTIEITPAMLDAGSRALAAFYLGHGIYDLQEDCLAAIYHAMNEAQ